MSKPSGTQLSLGLSLQSELAAERTSLGPGAELLRGFALADAEALFGELRALVQRAPFRHMLTPGGQRMSAAMSNAGELGWVSDDRGYRYQATDPETGLVWPALPQRWLDLASAAAHSAGFAHFVPDGCLINRYEPGARLSLHQDRNERDLEMPIVSVSLGIPATFLFGGSERTVRPQRVPLVHGDVAVWGGRSRLAYHGVLRIPPGEHPVTGCYRFNLTFRRAG